MEAIRATRSACLRSAGAARESAPICVLGQHELDYPRNIALQRALRTAGHELLSCHSRLPFPFRHLSLLAQLLGMPPAVKVIYVTEGGHRLVPWVRLVSRLTGRRLLFDPFLSRYSTRVEDRGLYAAGSVQARVAHFQDWSATHASDFLLFDTEEHREYFTRRYGLTKPSAVVPVGVPEELFVRSTDALPEDSNLELLFYGTYIPLQGVETIVAAAALLRDDARFRFTLIGEGQTHASVRAAAQRLGVEPPRLQFVPPVPFEEIPQCLARSHIALGIFGTTDKASRVVPNKVVQAAAMGRPIVTADSTAIRRYFEHGTSVHLVPPGDPRALATALRELADDRPRRMRLADGARAVFEQHFSNTALTRILSQVLDTIGKH